MLHDRTTGIAQIKGCCWLSGIQVDRQSVTPGSLSAATDFENRTGKALKLDEAWGFVSLFVPGDENSGAASRQQAARCVAD
jgi:hypothetical protein